jgi:medium-chain acyl-[acyl-carrier-protein] hydrolase
MPPLDASISKDNISRRNDEAASRTVAFDTPWIVPWRRTPHAEVTLVAFPYAGGTASMVRPWLDALPVWSDLLAVQYPGRETRIAETAFDRAGPLADAIAAELGPRLHGPVCFIGHSMGALLAFLVAGRLGALGWPEPDHLIVAGRRAPHLPNPFEPAHALPEPQFLARLRRLNGTPAAVFESAELLELLMPMLRADFAVNETYRHDGGAPAPCTVTTLGGTRDPMATPEELSAWAMHAPGNLTLHLFEGEHFFIRSAQTAVLDRVSTILAGLRSGAGAQGAS